MSPINIHCTVCKIASVISLYSSTDSIEASSTTMVDILEGSGLLEFLLGKKRIVLLVSPVSSSCISNLSGAYSKSL